MHGKCDILRSTAVRFAYRAEINNENKTQSSINNVHFICAVVVVCTHNPFDSLCLHLVFGRTFQQTAATTSEYVNVYISTEFHVAVDLMDFQQSKIQTEHHRLSNLMSDHFEFICGSAFMERIFCCFFSSNLEMCLSHRLSISQHKMECAVHSRNVLNIKWGDLYWFGLDFERELKSDQSNFKIKPINRSIAFQKPHYSVYLCAPPDKI